MKDQKILVKFSTDTYKKILQESDKRGLGKSSFVRMIVLKALQENNI
tara:strand:- start:1258 stop:1398 length:141 start_codon:yes stop_codon:yes gene_type:complete